MMDYIAFQEFSHGPSICFHLSILPVTGNRVGGKTSLRRKNVDTPESRTEDSYSAPHLNKTSGKTDRTLRRAGSTAYQIESVRSAEKEKAALLQRVLMYPNRPGLSQLNICG